MDTGAISKLEMPDVCLQWSFPKWKRPSNAYRTEFQNGNDSRTGAEVYSASESGNSLAFLPPGTLKFVRFQHQTHKILFSGRFPTGISWDGISIKQGCFIDQTLLGRGSPIPVRNGLSALFDSTGTGAAIRGKMASSGQI